MQPGAIRSQLNELVNGTQSSGVTSHTFRKTFATQVTRQVGIDEASRILGHSNPSVTRTFYVAHSTLTPDATSAIEVFNQEGL